MRSCVPQEQVDKLIVNFIIGEVLSVNIVDEPSFIALIGCGFPKRKIISQSTIKRKIANRFEEMKSEILQKLDRAKFVSTTCDIWSSGETIIYW